MGYETEHQWNGSAAISGTCEAPCSVSVPDWVAQEIKATWQAARAADGEMAAFRIIERMVDRLGYGRRENNPSLVPNAEGTGPSAKRGSVS